jgi:hypothetical protein
MIHQAILFRTVREKPTDKNQQGNSEQRVYK